MNIDKLKVAVKVCHLAGISLYVHGHQGVGKSEGLKSYCSNNFHFYDKEGKGTIPFGMIDFRAATMEAAEIRGLPEPDRELGRTTYFPMAKLPSGEWINDKGEIYGNPGDPKPKEGNWVQHRGILFCDEINRGEDDVLNAWFEMVYDRKVDEYYLPTGWAVVVAGNPSGSKFSVNSFVNDAAFLDRFCHVRINIDDDYRKSWSEYIHNMGINSSIAMQIVQFCNIDANHLYVDDNDYEELDITPSPRSWAMVGKLDDAILKVANDFDDETLKSVRYELLRGLVGSLADRYINEKIDILPEHIIEHGMSDAIVAKLENYERTQLQSLTWGVAGFAYKIKDPTETQRNNVIDFGEWVANNGKGDRDLAVAYFNMLLEEQKSRVRRLSISNPSLKKLINKIKKSTPWYDAIINRKPLYELLQKTYLGKLEEDD